MGKDGPACDFSVIRKEGDSLNRGAAETTYKQCAATNTKKYEKKETSTEGWTVKQCGKVIFNNTDSQQTQLKNELDSLDQCTVTSTGDINHWRQMQES